MTNDVLAGRVSVEALDYVYRRGPSASTPSSNWGSSGCCTINLRRLIR
jgi:hypothetical protein